MHTPHQAVITPCLHARQLECDRQNYSKTQNDVAHTGVASVFHDVLYLVFTTA